MDHPLVLDKSAVTRYVASNRHAQVSKYANDHKMSLGAAGLEYTNKLIKTLPRYAKILEKKQKESGIVNNVNAQRESCESYTSKQKWEKIEATVDSGASNHVSPANVGKQFPIQETQASANGECFSAAEGSKMRNLGCKDICAVTDTHNKIKTRVQVVENIKRTLLSVNKLVEAGNEVLFRKNNSCIYNVQTRKTVPIHKSNGVYKMNLWVPQDSRDPKSMTTGRINRFANQVNESSKQEDTKSEASSISASGFMRRLVKS